MAGTGNDFISLAWDTSPLGDLAGYKVYYDTDSTGFPYADTVDVGTDISHTLLGLPLGTTFYLAVTCYDVDGKEIMGNLLEQDLKTIWHNEKYINFRKNVAKSKMNSHIEPDICKSCLRWK